MCKLSHCNNKNNFTNDGYCYKHKAWSLEEDHIADHISKYLISIRNTKKDINRIKKVTKLYNYILYKQEFIKNNNKLKTILLQKAIEHKIICNNLKHIDNKYNLVCTKCIISINEILLYYI